MMKMLATENVDDINVVSEFLANEQIESLLTCEPVELVVMCVCAILPIAETVFNALAVRPDLTTTFVLCGGIGHSTELLYDAVAHSPKYQSLAADVRGEAEAVVLHRIMQKFHSSILGSNGPRILVEAKSTNCGSNAIETRKLLAENSIPMPKSGIIIQDPTMSIRTLASFQKAFADLNEPPQFLTCPTFVPSMGIQTDQLVFNVPGMTQDQLWSQRRFFDLIMGEYPRLRDDEQGYGPKGKNFISHVEIPLHVEQAWLRLASVVDSGR